MKELNYYFSFADIWIISGDIKFEKCVDYANKMTDDVILSTQFYIKYINRAFLANLQCRPLKFARLVF